MHHYYSLFYTLWFLACSVVPAIAIEKFAECEKAANGTFIARAVSSDNCLSYIYCDGSESYTDDCPQGTYFDADHQKCTLIWGDFKCPPKMALHESTTQASEVITEITTFSVAYTPYINEEFQKPLEEIKQQQQEPTFFLTRPICRRDQDAYFPHPLRCEYYYRCFAGYLSILRCNFNDSWDYEQEQCVSRQMAKCFKLSALRKM